MLNNLCFQIVVLKKLLSSLDRKEIKPVNPRRSVNPRCSVSPEYSLMLSIDVSLNAKIEVPVIWPLVGKTQFIGKVPDAQKV